MISRTLEHEERAGVEASARQTAPGELELVRQFLNTHDVEEGLDEIATPDQLRDWFAAHRLEAGADLGRGDVERATALREALRALTLANNGEPLNGDALATLNSVASRTQLLVRF